MKNSKFTTYNLGIALFKNTFLLSFLFLICSCFSCNLNNNRTNEKGSAGIASNSSSDSIQLTTQNIVTGAEQFEEYREILSGKKVGLVGNQTSVVYLENDTNIHLVDFLIQKEVEIKKVFAPEHGFRGKADAGEYVKDGVDSKTGLPIISLYGKNKKPTAEQLDGLDLIIFDIQDVGARFYTYISALHYVMEVCAELGIMVLVLDRPNPNGHYIDGPILDPEYASFVGMHPVPVVHGMTIGEFAQMINGEQWLKGGIQCDLEVIKMQGYDHQTPYAVPIKPSPNLPNDTAINLYPSLCFFEGTIVSAGRGTNMQFQIFGAPSLPSEYFPFRFTPQSNEGAKYPKFKGEDCNGLDLRESESLDRLNLEWLIDAYAAHGKRSDFFIPFFTNLAGTTKLQEQIERGFTYKEIRASWLSGLKAYDSMRKKYMLYN